MGKAQPVSQQNALTTVHWRSPIYVITEKYTQILEKPPDSSMHIIRMTVGIMWLGTTGRIGKGRTVQFSQPMHGLQASSWQNEPWDLWGLELPAVGLHHKLSPSALRPMVRRLERQFLPALSQLSESELRAGDLHSLHLSLTMVVWQIVY